MYPWGYIIPGWEPLPSSTAKRHVLRTGYTCWELVIYNTHKSSASVHLTLLTYGVFGEYSYNNLEVLKFVQWTYSPIKAIVWPHVILQIKLL